MLNRLYIVVGVLLILVITATFIVPMLFDWSVFRQRMEVIASEALGAPVAIKGDISFTLLPQPGLKFDTVVVGAPEAPVARIDAVEARFSSILDFLRDRYAVANLRLTDPDFVLDIDPEGRLVAPISLPESISTTNVSIANATIANGMFTLRDARSGDSWQFSKADASLKISALRGPFSVQGSGIFEGQRYQVRFASSAINSDGIMQMTSFVRPESQAFSLEANGQVQTGVDAKFSGRATYRQTPQPEPGTDVVLGDLVLDADVEARPSEVRITGYTLQPDENRPATRLTGEGKVQLGADPRFDLTATGGVVALSPPEVTDANQDPVQVALAFLKALPPPPVPPIDGQIQASVGQLDMRDLSLRNVELVAKSNGDGWTVDRFDAQLPGESALTLRGNLAAQAEHPVFNGEGSITSDRLDALSQMWRRPADGNPLMGMSGSLTALVDFSPDKLALTQGTLTLDDVNNRVSAKVSLSDTQQLSVTADLGRLDARQSAALRALLPQDPVGGPVADAFKSGTFDLNAQALTLWNEQGQDLVARGKWDKTGMVFDALNGSIGGMSFALNGSASGALDKPVIAGRGRVNVASSAQRGALPLIYDALGTPEAVRVLLANWFPASVEVDLSAPGDASLQTLSIDGRVAGADIVADVDFANGIMAAQNAPVRMQARLNAPGIDELAGLIGASNADFPASPDGVSLVLNADGALMNSLDVEASLNASEDGAHYAGTMVVSDLAHPRTRGKLDFKSTDPAPWAEMLGAAGLYLPPLKGAGELALDQDGALTATALSVDADGVNVSGQVSRRFQGGRVTFDGDLTLDRLDVAAVAELAGGPAAMIKTDGIWPDGPFSQDDTARTSVGRIDVSAASINSGDTKLAQNASFGLVWDETNLRISRLTADLGGGHLTLDAGICCSGTLSSRQVSGQLALDSVAADALMPPAPAETLDGTVDGSLKFEATGESYAAMAAALTGSGSFTFSDLSIAHLDPAAFQAAAEIDNITEVSADDLAAGVRNALNDGAFSAASMSGTLSLAGGRLRAENLGADNDKANLFGGLTLDISDLGLDGMFTLTPSGRVDENGLITPATARIVARVAGTLLAPLRLLDLAAMTDAVQVRALEIELDRLEKLRAQDEARARAAAEERARRMAEEAKRKADEALKAEQQRQAQEAASQTEPQPQPQDNGSSATPAPQQEPLPATRQQSIEDIIRKSGQNSLQPLPPPSSGSDSSITNLR